MIGLIAAALGVGLCGKALHNKKMANSYTVAKYFEHAMDKGKGCSIEGYFNINEVIRIMIQDGYDPSTIEFA